MAHSPNGYLLGRAAVTELAEQRQELYDIQKAALEAIRHQKLGQLAALERMVMQECADLEGLKSFVEWYESNQVPSPSKYSERIAIIRRRISRLRNYDFSP